MIQETMLFDVEVLVEAQEAPAMGVTACCKTGPVVTLVQ